MRHKDSAKDRQTDTPVFSLFSLAGFAHHDNAAMNNGNGNTTPGTHTPSTLTVWTAIIDTRTTFPRSKLPTFLGDR